LQRSIQWRIQELQEEGVIFYGLPPYQIFTFLKLEVFHVVSIICAIGFDLFISYPFLFSVMIIFSVLLLSLISPHLSSLSFAQGRGGGFCPLCSLLESAFGFIAAAVLSDELFSLEEVNKPLYPETKKK